MLTASNLFFVVYLHLNIFIVFIFTQIESVSASTQSTLEINSFDSLSPLGAPSAGNDPSITKLYNCAFCLLPREIFADLNGIMNTKVTAGAAADNGTTTRHFNLNCEQ